MLIVETITKVRIACLRDGKSIRETARKFNLSRNTVRNIIRSDITDQKYERNDQPRPKLGIFVEKLAEWLQEDSIKPVRHRRSAQILFEQLQREGYDGGYDTLRRYVGTWKKEAGTALVKAFVPLEFDPGEAFQFDWSYEKIELGGVSVEIKIAHFCATAASCSVSHIPERSWRWFSMPISGHSSFLAVSASVASMTT
jgi:transposase